MVNVERQATVATVRDEAALDIFRHQWELYRKFLRHDYLENAGAYAALHRFLIESVTRPFAFVDLACGDASGIVTALEGTAIARYCGVDLAPPALELAKRNLEALLRGRTRGSRFRAGDAARLQAGRHCLDQPVAASSDHA